MDDGVWAERRRIVVRVIREVEKDHLVALDDVIVDGKDFDRGGRLSHREVDDAGGRVEVDACAVRTDHLVENRPRPREVATTRDGVHGGNLPRFFCEQHGGLGGDHRRRLVADDEHAGPARKRVRDIVIGIGQEVDLHLLGALDFGIVEGIDGEGGRQLPILEGHRATQCDVVHAGRGVSDHRVGHDHGRQEVAGARDRELAARQRVLRCLLDSGIDSHLWQRFFADDAHDRRIRADVVTRIGGDRHDHRLLVFDQEIVNRIDPDGGSLRARRHSHLPSEGSVVGVRRSRTGHRVEDRYLRHAVASANDGELAAGRPHLVGSGDARLDIDDRQAGATLRDFEAVGRRGAVGTAAERVFAEAESREGLPDQANVLAVEGGGGGCLDDAVTHIGEIRRADGVLQTLVDVEHGAHVAGAASDILEIGVEAMRIDQRPVDFPRRLPPDLADAVRDALAVDALIGVIVDGRVGAVALQADARAVDGVAARVAADAAWAGAQMAGLGGVGEQPPITQPLAGLLVVLQTAHVRRPAHQAVRDTVAVFMHDDAAVEVTVTARSGTIPIEHLHSRSLTVGRSTEVRVVAAATVLRLGKHVVGLGAAGAIIVLLEVPRRLIEAV